MHSAIRATATGRLSRSRGLLLILASLTAFGAAILKTDLNHPRSDTLTPSGLERGGDNVLELRLNEPDDLCVRPGEAVTATLSQHELTALVRGYQAFLAFDDSRLIFAGGYYILPMPFGLPIITPIAATGADINLAAGIDDEHGQSPTSTSADLVTLTFTAGVVEGLTNVVFRPHDPPTRFSDAFGQAIEPTLIDTPFICIDGTPPTIQCPPDLELQCISEIPPPAADHAEFAAQGGWAEDDGCFDLETPAVEHIGDVVSGTAGCPSDPYVVERTYRAIDCAGNQSECTQIITVIDDIPPVIAGIPENLFASNDAGVCGAMVDWSAPTATDNCGVATVMQSQGPAPGSTFEVGGPYTIGYTATDACGNISEVEFTITVEDNEAPTIVCPVDISVNADAGTCTAAVIVPAPTVADNCGVAEVLNDFNGTGDASGTYPSGTTTVTWTVTDIHGNTANCAQAVTVSGYNELLVSVQLSPTMVYGPITRCITFELWNCTTLEKETVETPLAFTNGTSTVDQIVLVPCEKGPFSCITARDKLHTLRRTAPLGGLNRRYTAVFTGDPSTSGDWLIGGNLNGDSWIDILDFGEFTSEWNVRYGSGDTTCSTPAPHADLSGNGLVFTEDFTFIQINYLKGDEANCCGMPNLNDDGRGDPITEIAVDELTEMGLDVLIAGDLNGDGWLDQGDIAAFLLGARPSHGPTSMENSRPERRRD